MAEYIERERIRGMLKDHYYPTDQDHEYDRQWAVGFNAGLDKALHKIYYAPAADVVEVVHGRWIDRSDKGVISLTHPYVCNRCGRVEMLKEPYCNCGARMDGDKDAH